MSQLTMTSLSEKMIKRKDIQRKNIKTRCGRVRVEFLFAYLFMKKVWGSKTTIKNKKVNGVNLTYCTFIQFILKY